MPTPAALDAHVHVWDPALHRHVWLDALPALNRRIVPSDFGDEPAAALVVVQADCLPSQAGDEARWVDALADSEWPQIQAIVAYAAIEDGAAVSAELTALQAIRRVKGIRRPLQDEDHEFFARDDVHEGLARVAKAGLVFEACVRHWQLKALHSLLRSHPDLPVVLDHLGKPPVDAGWRSQAAHDWEEDLRRLAGLPQVFLKLSGLPAEISRPGTGLGDLRPWLDAGGDAFGADRSMMGSDWPVSAIGAAQVGYREWLDFVCAPYSGPDADAVAGGTARRVYGLESSGGPEGSAAASAGAADGSSPAEARSRQTPSGGG